MEASFVAQSVKNWPAMQKPACRDRLQCRRPRFNSWVRRTPGEGNGNPLQYSCLRNPMDREAWLATVYGVTRVGHNLATKLLLLLLLLLNRANSKNKNHCKTEKRRKKIKTNQRTNQNVKIIINVFLWSHLSASFHLLWVTLHLASLGCPPTLDWPLDLLWGWLRL